MAASVGYLEWRLWSWYREHLKAISLKFVLNWQGSFKGIRFFAEFSIFKKWLPSWLADKVIGHTYERDHQG